MAQYSQEELLNELSQILRGRLEPTKDGGTVDPAAIHAQVMEIAKTVFLLNPGAIFYLARLIRNTFLLTVRQEIAVLEDMLLAIDDMSHPPGLIGEVGPRELNNATTALLSLEFAGSVNGRPELQRFQRIMDKFTGLFKGAMVDPKGRFILPRGEARDILRDNLANLKLLHATTLDLLNGIISLVEEFNDLDIPSQVSQTALINVRKQLQSILNTIAVSTQEELIRDSRLIVLRSLTSKVVVALLEQFSQVSLTAPKLTSDNTGSASDPDAEGPFLARAAGVGTPASVLTAPGPWRLDSLSSGVITFRIDGGVVQTVDLTVVQGPGIHGRNKAPFTDAQLYPLWPGPGGPLDPPPPAKKDYEPRPNLHVILDRNTYEFTSEAWGHVDNTGTFHPVVNNGGDLDPDLQRGELLQLNLIDSPRADGSNFANDYWNTVQMQPPVKLGFKHLGCLMFLTLGEVPEGNYGLARKGAGFGGWNVDGQDMLDDASEWNDIDDRRWDYLLRPRTIYDLELLTTVTLTHVVDGTYSVAGNAAQPHWVGFYSRTGTGHGNYERYEIIRVAPDGSELEFDLRGQPSSVMNGVTKIFGSRGDRSQITFFPDLLADTDNVADSATGSERGPATVPNTATIKIGPAVKTARIPPTQGGSIASVIAALNNPANGDYDSLDNRYQHASYHCIFKDQNGFSERITVQGRSRYLADHLQISGMFFKTHMFLPAKGTGDSREVNPGPVPMVRIEQSGHQVFGFSIGQKVDPKADPYLSVEELLALFKDVIDEAYTAVDIVETDVLTGLLSTVAGTFNVQDTSINFADQGVGLGYLLEIQDGDSKGIYFVESATGSFLTLTQPVEGQSTGFAGNETGVSYRLFTQQLRISSTNTGPLSSVEVTAAPAELALPSSPVHGLVPAIEAVNGVGELLDLSKLSPGDVSGGLVVESASGTQATIAGGVSADVLGLRFSFDGKTEGLLAKMISDLTTIRDSKNLLGKHNYSSNVDRIDAALTSLVTPGQAFQSNLNQARVLIADLLAVLTSSPPLEGEYTATIPTLVPTMESATSTYDAPQVKALDALLDSLNEHGFDRALSLLLTGKLEDFFNTTAATASFAGAMLEASRTVAADVPTMSTVQSDVEEATTVSDTFRAVPSADVDFSDTEGARQDLV